MNKMNKEHKHVYGLKRTIEEGKYKVINSEFLCNAIQDCEDTVRPEKEYSDDVKEWISCLLNMAEQITSMEMKKEIDAIFLLFVSLISSRKLRVDMEINMLNPEPETRGWKE